MREGDERLIVFQADRTPPSVRIRNNQRRSRARRKEYVEDLEQRLRQFERHGVEATTEVQTAARKVARENVLLRALLVTKGVSNNEIDEYLRAKPYNPDIIPAPAKAPISGSETDTGPVIPLAPIQGPLIRAPCSPGNNCYNQKNNLSPELIKLNDNHKQVLPQVAMIKPPDSTCCSPSAKISSPTDPQMGRIALAQPVQNIEKAFEPCAPGAINKPLITETTNSQNLNLMDDESTCEAAANIIASMRGHGDTEKVLAELGCTSNRSCAVKNMTIFELTDR